MADYGGLDPSVMQYVQGGGMPMAQPVLDDPSMYGLPPQVLSGVQNGFAPVDQVTASTLGPRGGSSEPIQQPTPQLPPVATSTLGPRGRNNFGVDPSVAGAPGSPEVADTQVPSVTGGALPSQDAAAQPIATQPLQPDQTIGTAAPLTDKQVVATNKLYAAQQAHAEAFANSPEGLAAKADAENRAAIEKSRQSALDADAAQAAQNDAIAKATVESTARQAEQEKLDAAQRAKDQAATAQYTQQYAQQIKDAADFKVNTNRDIGMGGLIAVALSGIGDALMHRQGPNAALEIINKRIDQGISDQWAQKKALGDKAASTKDLLETSRQTAGDDRQDQDVAKAAALTDAKNQIANIAAQSANPMLKARGEQIQAGLDQQVAGLTMGLANRKLEAQKVATDQANKRTELGIAGGHLALARKSLDEQIREHDLQRQDKLDELQLNYDKLGQKALADKAKELKTSGVYDPTTGNALLDASAQPALLAAKRLDMQAAAASDPAQQQQLAAQAKQLRDNINVQYGITNEDKEGKLKDEMAAAKALANANQHIRDALEDGSITDRETRAALKTEQESAKANWIALHGGKPSSREFEAIGDMFGSDAGSVAATNANKSKILGALKALDVENGNFIGTKLRARGIKAIDSEGNPWVPQADKPVASTAISGKTSVEKGVDATPGVVTQATGVDLRHPFTSPEARDPLNVENAGDLTPTGLSKQDDSQVLGLIKTYGKVSPDENQRVVSSLVNLVGSPDDERKQAVANAVITRVKAESPQLYRKVLEALPADRRKQLTQFDLPPVVLDHVMGKK